MLKNKSNTEEEKYQKILEKKERDKEFMSQTNTIYTNKTSQIQDTFNNTNNFNNKSQNYSHNRILFNLTPENKSNN